MGIDPVSAGIGAAGGVLGTVIQGQFNQAQAGKQMGFQERMSNTAYTRAVADMKNAGLNPGLMFGSGSAASTPTGATAEMENPGIHIQQGINTGIQAKAAAATQDLQRKQGNNVTADTINKQAEKAILDNQAKLTAGSAQSIEMQNKILKETLQSQIKKAKAEGDYSELNQIMGLINQGAGAAGQFVSPIKIKGPR